MTSRTAATLHVTNGDTVLYLFKKAGITGTHLAWRDALYEGPVHGGALEEASAYRARFASARGYGNPIKIIHDFERRDAQLHRAAEFEEVVLWFEHDLFDQLQILQILTALETLDLEPGRIAIVQSDHYLGTMTADELSPLLARRRTVTAATFRSARRAWERFTSTSPLDLYVAAKEDAIGLPFLRSAMQRLCEEYPWVRDGLSRSQRQALQAVAQGAARNQELFRRAQAREEAGFLSDVTFAKIVAELEAPQAPLLEAEGTALVLTALGRRVLAGDADWLDAAGIDRWIGGVHLESPDATRWDDDKAQFLGGSS
ncbi:MAG TPA: hypothetical protein VFE36_14510 [Candidatus Baltobacteraceae bacterium]|jgi:hypothetical protein|nr:hypothetical protein [Candidatus Baltobacteraceae bacterium]